MGLGTSGISAEADKELRRQLPALDRMAGAPERIVNAGAPQKRPGAAVVSASPRQEALPTFASHLLCRLRWRRHQDVLWRAVLRQQHLLRIRPNSGPDKVQVFRANVHHRWRLVHSQHKL